VAPGEIIVVYGSNFGPSTPAQLQYVNGVATTTLGNTRVYFDNIPAPMIYVASGVLSCVVPYSVAGRTSTQVQVEYNSVKGNALAVPVVDSVPGIFSLNQSGTGPGAILNWPDYTVNGASNRVAAGGSIMAYATGEGKTDIAIDGQKVPLTGAVSEAFAGAVDGHGGGQAGHGDLLRQRAGQHRRTVPGERADPAGPGAGRLRSGDQGRRLHQHGRANRGGEVAWVHPQLARRKSA
jgi:uncharacterized protein (TIGR03437 family)